MSKVYVFDHPLIQHKVSLMRKTDTVTKEFRELATEVAMLMGFEATRDLELEEVENMLSSIPYHFDKKDSMLVTLPMFHGFGLIVGVHAALSADVKAVLLPRFNGKSALKEIKRHKITTMIAKVRISFILGATL